MVYIMEINENDAPLRLDRYIRKRFPELPLSRVYSLIRNGCVKINGSRVKRQSTLLMAGQRLEIQGMAPNGKSQCPKSGKKASSIPFAVLYEDSDCLAVDKPSGVSVHPGGGIPTGDSMIEIILNYLDYDGNALFRPSLVHRLDKETSGVLLVAKTGRFLRYMNEQIRQRRVDKIYYALVAGRPGRARGAFSENLLRKNQPFGGRKSLVYPEKGKKALTQYELAETIGDFSLLHLRLLTGRHHQIRAHLTYHNLPILGDRRYGHRFYNDWAFRLLGLKRTFLHAAELRFSCLSGDVLDFHAALPADLTACLANLRNSPGI